MTLFANLPDDCVQLIFDRIPTQSLLLCRRVCHAWQRHQQLNCRRRKTLIVLHGSWPYYVIHESFFIKKFAAHNIDQNGNWLNYGAFIDHNRIRSTKLKTLKVNYLVQTFPNVRTLIIASDRTLSAHLRSFNELITNYSSQLVSLQMYFSDDFKNSAQQKSVSIVIGNLINLLNSLSALQHFTLDAPWTITPAIEAPEFLTRINEFYFKCRGLRTEMYNWLRKYEQEGRLHQLVRINVAQRCSPSKSAEELSASRMSHWPVRHSMAFVPYDVYEYRMCIDRLTSIIAHFPSLTTISIDCSCLPCQKREKGLFERPSYLLYLVSLSKLANLLSPLTKLVLLRLVVEQVNILPEALDPSTTPQLKSIKALKVDFGEFVRNDCSMFRNVLITFVHIFPNLRSIRVITDEQDEHKSNCFTQSARDLLGELKCAYGRDAMQMTVTNHFTRPFKL